MTEIDELIPHRPPMRLIDAVAGFDRETQSVVCTATLRPSPVLTGGDARAVIALELMAQSAAACTGLLDGGDGEPARGFLVAVPALELTVERLALGDELEIHARRVSVSGASASFECAVSRGGEPVATGRLTVLKEGGS
jgi:predicted hotdog family 3-hydroxylacyl-ACP dehydratase